MDPGIITTSPSCELMLMTIHIGMQALACKSAIKYFLHDAEFCLHYAVSFFGDARFRRMWILVRANALKVHCWIRCSCGGELNGDRPHRSSPTTGDSGRFRTAARVYTSRAAAPTREDHRL